MADNSYIVVEGDVSIITVIEPVVEILTEYSEPEVIIFNSVETGLVGEKGVKGDPGNPDDIDMPDLTLVFDNKLV